MILELLLELLVNLVQGVRQHIRRIDSCLLDMAEQYQQKPSGRNANHLPSHHLVYCGEVPAAPRSQS